MKAIQRYFKPSLADKYAELSSKEADREEFMVALMNEIRTELEQAGNSESEKSGTFTKLFLVVLHHRAHQ